MKSKKSLRIKKIYAVTVALSLFSLFTACDSRLTNPMQYINSIEESEAADRTSASETTVSESTTAAATSTANNTATTTAVTTGTETGENTTASSGSNSSESSINQTEIKDYSIINSGNRRAISILNQADKSVRSLDITEDNFTDDLTDSKIIEHAVKICETLNQNKAEGNIIIVDKSIAGEIAAVLELVIEGSINYTVVECDSSEAKIDIASINSQFIHNPTDKKTLAISDVKSKITAAVTLYTDYVTNTAEDFDNILARNDGLVIISDSSKPSATLSSYLTQKKVPVITFTDNARDASKLRIKLGILLTYSKDVNTIKDYNISIYGL